MLKPNRKGSKNKMWKAFLRGALLEFPKQKISILSCFSQVNNCCDFRKKKKPAPNFYLSKSATFYVTCQN